MSYAKLVSEVSTATGVPKAAVRRVLSQAPKSVASMVRGGYTVIWPSLGKFDRKHYKAREVNGREVPDMLIARFKLSSTFKSLVKRVLIEGVEVIEIEPAAAAGAEASASTEENSHNDN